MIEATEDGHGVCCDFCSTEVEFRTHRVAQVLFALHARGWQITRDEKGKWQHRCPCCVEDVIVNSGGSNENAEAT